MSVEWQLTIDCADPGRLVPFWAQALGYVPTEPPPGHTSWRKYYLRIGVQEAELEAGAAVDRLVDPTGRGPAIWFQVVPEGKSVKNRLHIDLKVGGGRAVQLPERRRRVDAKVASLEVAGVSVVRVPTPRSPSTTPC